MSWLFHCWLSFFLISLLVFEDCRGLFLRHSETGKCVTVSEELVYNLPDHALPYYVVMTDDCLDDKAQFRYLSNTELLHNIEKGGTLVSPKGSNYNKRWAVYDGVSTTAKAYEKDATKHRLKQTAAGSLFFYKKKNICAEPSSKYLLRKSYCNNKQQDFTFGSVTAFNGKMENVHCSPIQLMRVKSADYGDFGDGATFNQKANIDVQCSAFTSCQVKSLCSGKRSCELTLNNNLLPSKYCFDTSKQIYTKYTCVDNYTSSAITAAPKIRLTKQNGGYIEIENGSDWRKVNEENWDENRQKMLCQHLGFDEIDGNVIQTGQLGSGQQIATGDLICYDTPPSGTSCCVHLTPSTSTTSTRIPDVRCKICDNPLLHNTTTFPDSVFSGSGDSNNTYKDARITKGGWCPSGSGIAYLTLDLQKEYHITQVVVMADKEQTEWSGSYSLNYSHDTSFKNTEQISGNQEGYRASRASLNIFNVRHVKIESTGNRSFCLRIELCGEVQTPAQASDVIVSPSQYSVNVTWEISTSTQDSSYITHIIVYLNNKRHKTIARGTQVTIDGLTPYTNYTVGIQTQDGSSQTSEIFSKNFTTKDAVLPVVISKIRSTAPKKYNISWVQPVLPVHQKFQKYCINYGTSNGSKKPYNVSSKDETSFIIDVEYEKRYTFEIRVVIQTGLISNVSSVTWFSYSAPLVMPIKTNDGYRVLLNKPKKEQKIKSVSLVLLKSKLESPPAPEDIELQKSPPSEGEDDIAFVAKVFDITEFQEDTIEISLQQSKSKRRKKRNAVVVPALAPMSTYRTAQLNTDESGNELWSYWSESFNFTGVSNPGKSSGHDDGSVAVAAGAAVAAVVVVVLLVVAVIYFRRRQMYKQRDENEIVADGKKRRGKTDDKELNAFENRYAEEEVAYPHDSVADGNSKDVHNEKKNAFENDFNEEDVAKPDDTITNGNDIYSNELGDVGEKAHPPVPISEFSHYVNELKTNKNREFKKQYDHLPKFMKTPWEVSKKPFNKKKNRYGNIVTYDYCRVVLSGDERKDYINASYMNGIKDNSHIASQGPNKLTVDDMWRMVWEQRSYSIVMVTSLIELGKPKCEKYWPDKGTKMYGDIEVTLVKVQEFSYYITHTLQLKKDGEEREVKHYYFQSWPDHGVPKYPTQLLAFRRHFRTHHLEQSGPIVVHCSAGVGRTGVFLAIDTILEKLEKGVIDSIDVFGEVCAMRERRMNMVQTLEQYIFIHEAIMETILCGMNEVDSSKIQEEIKQLAKIRASGMTGFQEKFKTLGEVSPKLSPEECTAALLEENHSKNRNKNTYPAERNRVPLQYVDGVENSDYINAAFVNGYLGRNYFIATQSPLPNTINDFWRLVHSQKTSTIVLLNNVKDGTSFPKFWPTNRGKPTQYDRLTVQLESEKESDGIWTRKFILSPYPDLSDGQVVNIFHYTKWPDHRVPSDASGVIKLTSLVETARKSYGHGPIIVACSDGAGRTGTYITISNLLERMKIEQAMDVFQSIKMIRGTRPQFVENAEQYQFCYTTVLAYLDAFSEYANFD